MYLNRADQIAEEIQEQIFAGSFKDGERLDEIRLAEQFGVSRTPLREALKKVALLGIIEAYLSINRDQLNYWKCLR